MFKSNYVKTDSSSGLNSTKSFPNVTGSIKKRTYKDGRELGGDNKDKV